MVILHAGKKRNPSVATKHFIDAHSVYNSLELKKYLKKQ